MDIKKGRAYLTRVDLEQHPIWRFNDVDDLVYPIFGPEDFPEDSIDLKIRAEFATENGVILQGCIFGVINIFSIMLTYADELYYFNKNMPDDGLKALEKLSAALGKQLTIKDFSPLQYTTTIDLEHFKNISGEFYAFEKVNDSRYNRSLNKESKRGV